MKNLIMLIIAVIGIDLAILLAGDPEKTTKASAIEAPTEKEPVVDTSSELTQQAQEYEELKKRYKKEQEDHIRRVEGLKNGIVIPNEESDWPTHFTIAHHGVTNITWYYSPTQFITLRLSTNITTDWRSIDVMKTNLAKQVGYLVTNRTLSLLQAKQTNRFHFEILGKEERPSQFGTNRINPTRQ
jgi:hypothetical protein